MQVPALRLWPFLGPDMLIGHTILCIGCTGSFIGQTQSHVGEARGLGRFHAS